MIDQVYRKSRSNREVAANYYPTNEAILDLALTHTSMYQEDPNCRADMKIFVDSGGLSKFINNFRSAGCLGDISDIRGSFGQDILSMAESCYDREWDALCGISTLSQSAEQSAGTLSTFNFDTLYLQMQEQAPRLVSLLHLLGNVASASSNKSALSRTRRNIVMTLSQLSMLRSERHNYVQRIITFFLFASRAGKRTMNCLNHLGLSTSYATLQSFVTESARKQETILKQFASSHTAFAVVIDNLNFTARTRFERLDNKEQFCSWTVGLIFAPPASRRRKMFTLADINPGAIGSLRATHVIPTFEDYDTLRKSFVSLINDVLRRFSQNERIQMPPVTTAMPRIKQLDPQEPPEVHTLPTYDLDEAVIKDMVSILRSVQEATGVSDEQASENIVFHFGDFLTIRNIK
jgi:hypothetical protein